MIPLYSGKARLPAKSWTQYPGPLSHTPAKRFAVLVLLLVLSWLLVSPQSPRGRPVRRRIPRRSVTLENHRMHLLLPAKEPDAELCKSILSSHVLGYPVPTLIGWNKTVSDPEHDWHSNGTHIAKIMAMKTYLDRHKLPKDDIILTMDAYDTWLQLPPSVLVSRFRRINEENMRRAQRRIGKSAVHDEGIQHSIVFAAQKECGPRSAVSWDIDMHPMCYAQPASPLRSDLYGHHTDTKIRGTLLRYMRPKYLSSGLMVGYAGDMAKMVEAAHYLIHEYDHGETDQLVFGKLYGEQSWRREYIRRWHQSHMHKAVDRLKVRLGYAKTSFLDFDPDHPKREPMYAGHSAPVDFGIGLDYGLEISNTALWSEFDGRFLIHNTTQSLYKQQKAASVEVKPRVKAPLPADIMAADPPFHILRAGGKDVSVSQEKISTPWSAVPLYTNTFTGNVPVALHLNGRAESRKYFWHLMWYHQSLRDLLLSRAHLGKVGAYDDDGNFMKWDTICKPFHPEVFRDDLN